MTDEKHAEEQRHIQKIVGSNNEAQESYIKSQEVSFFYG